MLPSVKSILLAEDEATNSALQCVKENPGSILAMGTGAGMVIAPGLVVAPAISAAEFTTEGVFARSLAAGIQSVTEDVASNSAFAICQSYATGGFGTAVTHGFVQGTGDVVGLGSIFSKWKHNVNCCKSESLDNADRPKADGSGQEDNTGLNRDREMEPASLILFLFSSWTPQEPEEPNIDAVWTIDYLSPFHLSLTRKMQLLQNTSSTAMMATGAVLVVVPGLVATLILGILAFGAGGIAAGSAAAGIQSGIGSVAAGSAFATLQSAGAGGAGLAVVNGVVQASGAIVGASGLAAKLKGQGDGHSANGDREETDGTHEGNDAEEMNDQQKGVASLSPEDDNKPNGEGEGEVPQSLVERELMRFRRLKDDFFRPAAAAAAVEEEPKAPKRDRNFKRLCHKFRKGHCRRGASCDLYHLVPWELPGKDYTDHPVDLFFANFKGFDYQRDKSFFDEFYRMCDHFGWSDDEATEPWYNFRIALIEEFNYVFGEDENDLQNWKKMFKIIGLSEPTSLSEARTVMRPTRVNLVDMLQSTRTGEPVQRFESLEALSRYSYNTLNEIHDDGAFHDDKLFLNHRALWYHNGKYRTKVFPKDEAYAGGLLKMMLREISFQNPYLGTRLGGTQLNLDDGDSASESR
ncbi:hypothetical protein FDENT_7330 [Fusarium denticulatum]|uniref:C3H1-type domain-containing protein n=1 Tax=Fusarium denticulatum TaxID=48507 RepID=A0A8H5X109_9HYPO|nr:hypothetical protein FDENT_7330 [Fusarium denticulatum]